MQMVGDLFSQWAWETVGRKICDENNSDDLFSFGGRRGTELACNSQN